jgi:polyisoprenoid-binding protein YceI
MSVMTSPSAQALTSASWRLDPAHSAVEFRVRHLMVGTVRGRFREVDGTILAGEVPMVVGAIGTASVDTLHAGRDAHLRSPDFFDAERHPQITFTARGLDLDADSGRVSLLGAVTIKGVTRPLVLAGELRGGAVDLDGAPRVALALRGRLSRSAFGLVWNRVLESGGVLVGDAVELDLDLSLVRVEP